MAPSPQATSPQATSPQATSPQATSPQATSPSEDALRRAGDASVLILTSLAEGPKHGYALIQDVMAFSGVRLGPGTLYGALDRLEHLGLIEALPSQERRHPYRITPDGIFALRSHLDALDRVSRVGRLRLGFEAP